MKVKARKPERSAGITTYRNTEPIAVELRKLEHRYKDVVSLDGLTMSIKTGELLTLLGPSGSGKSTLLRVIAGLEQPASGRVIVDNQDVSRTAPHKRDIGVVFQDLALFPHMTVRQNIAFPLEMRKWGRQRMQRAVSEVLDMVKLPSIQDRLISELSGGQRQRVAIARALVYQPTLLLLDEPLSALDKKLREEMQLEILRLHQQLSVTIINVTHDQKEALLMSDRIALLNHGRLEQLATPHEIYNRPRTRFAAEFIGNSNMIPAVRGPNRHRIDAKLGDGSVTHPLNAQSPPSHRSDQQGIAVLRYEDITLSRTQIKTEALPGRVELAAYQGDQATYEVAVQGIGTIKAIEPLPNGIHGFKVGELVYVHWDPARILYYWDS